MNVHELIKNFDYTTATPEDLAILLEQVYTRHDPIVRDGGPVIVAGSILRKYDEEVRRRAAPELHEKMRGRAVELRSTERQLGKLLSQLEREIGLGTR